MAGTGFAQRTTPLLKMWSGWYKEATTSQTDKHVMKNKLVRSAVNSSVEVSPDSTMTFPLASLRIFLAAVGLLLCAFSASATDWYVRSGGAGSASGADWNNAWSLSTIAWSSVKPGDNIWVAGGTYSDALSIGASGAAGNYINIRRVLATDTTPVAAAGWSSAFDSQVIVAPSSTVPCAWNGSGTLGSYVAIDGRVDSGISFRLGNISGASYPAAVYFGQNLNGLAFVTLTNLECAGPVPAGSITYSMNSYLCGISFVGGPYGGSGIFFTDITVSHCRIHGAEDLVLLVGVQRALFDHDMFYDAPFDSGPLALHPNVCQWAFSGNITFRYSQFYNWYSEGIMMGASTDPNPNPYGAAYVYGNLFYNPNGGSYSARVIEARWQTQTAYMYNNTFVNFTGDPYVWSAVAGNGSWSSSTIGENNIYWNAQIAEPPPNEDYEFSGPSGFQTVAGTHSISAGSMPFAVSPVNDYPSTNGNNFTTVTNTGATYPAQKGVALVNTAGVLPGGATQSYNVDINGNLRGANGGNWSMGAYEPVSSSGSVATLTLSAITQNAADVDPNTSGLQVYQGTTVQYSGSATDVNPVTWQWSYTVNGGSSVVFQSGSGTIPAITFTYPTNSAGSSYVWTLSATDSVTALTAQSQLTVGVEAPPVAATGLTFSATSGIITSPFIVTNGYIYQQSPAQSTITNGGTATYTFNITNAGNYVIQGLVNAPTNGEDSFFVNIDAMPTDPYMIWKILPATVGFQNEVVCWQGTGAYNAPEFVPEVFNLTVGTHQLIIVGREAGTELQSISILQMVAPPQNLRVLPTVVNAPTFPVVGQ